MTNATVNLTLVITVRSQEVKALVVADGATPQTHVLLLGTSRVTVYSWNTNNFAMPPTRVFVAGAAKIQSKDTDSPLQRVLPFCLIQRTLRRSQNLATARTSTRRFVQRLVASGAKIWVAFVLVKLAIAMVWTKTYASLLTTKLDSVIGVLNKELAREVIRAAPAPFWMKLVVSKRTPEMVFALGVATKEFVLTATSLASAALVSPSISISVLSLLNALEIANSVKILVLAQMRADPASAKILISTIAKLPSSRVLAKLAQLKECAHP
jgi:hypothetical protein